MALPEILEQKMREQESDRRNIRTAQTILEAALIQQFRSIARALLAGRILREGADSLTDEAWWQQYRTLENLEAPFQPDPNHSDFLIFQRKFCTDVMHGAIQGISLADLLNVRVRIYGGDVPFWCEGRINRQLADLGSSMRLFVAGSDLARLRRISAMLGGPADGPDPGIFVLGSVAPATAIAKAALFEYVLEYAVSPYLDPVSPGLADLYRIVLRSPVAAMPLMRWSVFTMEFPHVFQDYPPGNHAGFTSWRAVARDDICRYAGTPRTKEEIQNMFQFVFEISRNEPFRNMFPPGESPVSLPSTLEELCRDGLLHIQSDGRYYCGRFAEGREWSLL